MRDLQLIQRLHQTLSHSTRHKRVQIVSHWGGDADSVGASYALSKLLSHIYEVSDVGLLIPEEISAHVKAIMNYLDFHEKVIADPDVYVLVDVGSLNQLGDLKQTVLDSGKQVIVIDHHLNTGEKENLHLVTSASYLAVSEMLYDLHEFLNIKPDQKTSEALFLGIYYDTVRLAVADLELSRKVASLIDKINPSNIIGMLEPKIEDAERIARLKALRRINIYKVGDWFVAVSNVNGYLSSVARTLVNVGAHVALVVGMKGDYTVIAARSSHDFQKYAGVTLGDDLAKYLLKRFEGDGGGHSGAARIRLKTTVESAISESLRGLSLLIGANAVELAG